MLVKKPSKRQLLNVWKKPRDDKGTRRSRDDDTTLPMSAETCLRKKEEDEDEANLSLAAMEAELRPQVMETLDLIADTYRKRTNCRTSRLKAAWLLLLICLPARSAATRN